MGDLAGEAHEVDGSLPCSERAECRGPRKARDAEKRCVQDIVRGINRDKSLSESDKARRIRAAVLDRKVVKKPRKPENDELTRRTYADEEKKVLGCKHYIRNCRLRANCCDRIVTCRICHDEDAAVDHKMDRHETKTVVCMECFDEQPVAKDCRSCGVEFAHYFCEICKLYNGDKAKDVYHCHDCGLCRVGKGVGIDNIHCHKCNACVGMQSQATHNCIEGSLEVECPICKECLFTSTRPVVFMRCGHTMHGHCYEEYTLTEFKCPICLRSLADMGPYYKKLAKQLKEEVLPPHYRGLTHVVHCNECTERSVTAFHPKYHMCSKCSSFNTAVISGPHRS